MANKLNEEQRTGLDNMAVKSGIRLGSDDKPYDYIGFEKLELLAYIEQLIAQAEQKAVMQFDQDIMSVLHFLDGNVEKVKIANFIREYITPELRKLQGLEGEKTK